MAGGAARGEVQPEWLASHAFGRRQPAPQLQVRTWLEGGALDARRDFAWASVAGLAADPALRLQWLTALLQQGMAFLSEVPAEQAAILEAMPLVGRVLETNYGLVFDVRSVPQPENLAYSDLGLGLHTDNPYREPVPGFQALHALIPSHDGGDSLFADGFALAEHLRAECAGQFRSAHRYPGAVPVSLQGRGAVCRASAHPAVRQRPGDGGALQQPLHRPAAAAGRRGRQRSMRPIATLPR